MRRLLVVTLGMFLTAAGVWFSFRSGQKQAASEAAERMRLERKAFEAGYSATTQSETLSPHLRRVLAAIQELRMTEASLDRQRAELVRREHDAVAELAGHGISHSAGAGPVYAAQLQQIELLRSQIAESERKILELRKNIRAEQMADSGTKSSREELTELRKPPDPRRITLAAILTGCVYYLAMVIGIFVSSAYEGLDRMKHSARVSFRRLVALATTVGSWQGLLVSPFVFAIVRGVIPAEGISFAIVLFAFQNGFFWRSTMHRLSRSRSVAPEAAVA